MIEVSQYRNTDLQVDDDDDDAFTEHGGDRTGGQLIACRGSPVDSHSVTDVTAVKPPADWL